MAPLLLLALACKPPAAPAADLPVTLRIVAMNDFHGALYEKVSSKVPDSALGGLPVLAGALDLLREEHPELLLLDAGDSFQGSWAVNATQGMGSVRAFELLGVDVTTLGNHDFDYGGTDTHPLRGALAKATAASSYPWVNANIVVAETGEPWGDEVGVRPWTLVERAGVKVGITGVLTQDTPQTTLPDNVADLAFTDPAEAVARVIPELQAAGAQVIVALAHLDGDCDPEPTGYVKPGPTCDPQGELGAFLDALPAEVDLVVAGHAHTLIAHRVGDALVMENRGRGGVLGQVDLVVGTAGVDLDASRVLDPWIIAHPPIDPGCEEGEYPLEPLEVAGRMVTPRAEALELIRSLEAEAGSLCDPAGCAAAPLGRHRERESAVGDLTADSMLATFERADLAIANSGGLRADIPQGSLRKEHLHAVIPFDNRLMLVQLTGEQLQLLFRIGSSGRHGILQVAGATYAFDPAVEEGSDLDGDGAVDTWERDRLCSVLVGGEPVDPERTYQVVTTDFIYNGGDHFGPVFSGAPVVEEGPLARDALMAFVEGQSECLGASGPLMDPQAPRISLGACPAP